MKKGLTIILFTTFLVTVLVAQEQKPEPANSFKYGFGTTFLGTGDFTGNSQYIEYDRNLFKPFSLGINGTFTKAFQTKTGGYEQNTKAYQADVNLFIRLFGNDVNRLKIGGGGAYRDSEHRYTTEIIKDADNNIVDKIFATDESKSWGWTAILEYEVFVARHIIIGSRLMYQRFENGDTIYFWGLNGGFRF